MSGLVIKLAPQERILINGAVIQNGDRRSRISIITPGAHILRLKDAIHRSAATTPLRQACHLVQQFLTGDTPIPPEPGPLVEGMTLLLRTTRAESIRLSISEAISCLHAGKYYHAMKFLQKAVLDEEKTMADSL